MTLRGAYRIESDSAIRSLIAEAVWQHRLPSCVEFLAVALEDPHPEVRKQALDGLVALASPESKRILELAKSRMVGHDTDFRDWIEEAIGLVQARGCLGNSVGTRPRDHTSPKRQRGFRLPSRAVRASTSGCYPHLNLAKRSVRSTIQRLPACNV